jgi:hypothetical protein
LDWQFKKRLTISVAKAKYFVVLPLPYVLESHALLSGNFFMTLNSVDRDEAMKRGNDALNASSLLFLRSVKRFIATIFYSALNVSSPLIFKRNHRLTLHRRYFFRGIHRLTLHRRYF